MGLGSSVSLCSTPGGRACPFLGKSDCSYVGRGGGAGRSRRAGHKPEAVPSALPGGSLLHPLCRRLQLACSASVLAFRDAASPSSGPLQRQPPVTPTAQASNGPWGWSLGFKALFSVLFLQILKCTRFLYETINHHLQSWRFRGWVWCRMSVIPPRGPGVVVRVLK